MSVSKEQQYAAVVSKALKEAKENIKKRASLAEDDTDFCYWLQTLREVEHAEREIINHIFEILKGGENND